MADTENDEFDIDDAAEEISEGSGGPKKLLLMVLPILLLGGGGAGLFYSGILDGDEKKTAQAEKPVVRATPTKSVYFDLPDMLVNLDSLSSKPHFLKFRASLELTSGIDVTVLLPLRPRIIDKFQVYMRELRLEDLRANGGIHVLRNELLASINGVVAPVKVKDVLFRNILVQ